MRFWRRLGVAAGVGALLAGGFVGVAAPAHAEHENTKRVRVYITIPTDYSNDRTSACKYNDINNLGGYGDRPAGWTSVKQVGYNVPGNYVTCDFYYPGDHSNEGDGGSVEPVQEISPPPPCWDPALNNCPVGGALRFAAPKYAMVGLPVTMYAYASWRPDANSPAQPTDGTAVIRVDGEDYSGVEFVDGVAEWRFIPKTEGAKEFTASGVVFSDLSGGNAYIDTVPGSTYVVPYDPEFFMSALKGWRVDIGEKFVITDRDQALSHAKKRYKWSVAPKSEDVCAVYTTKKREVKAKFNDYGTCTVRWLDRKSAEEGKYTFIVTKPKLNIG